MKLLHQSQNKEKPPPPLFSSNTFAKARSRRRSPSRLHKQLPAREDVQKLLLKLLSNGSKRLWLPGQVGEIIKLTCASFSVFCLVSHSTEAKIPCQESSPSLSTPPTSTPTCSSILNPGFQVCVSVAKNLTNRIVQIPSV